MLICSGKVVRRDEEEEDEDADDDVSLGDVIRESWEKEKRDAETGGHKQTKSSERKALKQGYFSDEDASD